MRLILVFLALAAGEVRSVYHEKRRYDRSSNTDQLSSDSWANSPRKTWIFTDHQTGYTAYKDKFENTCYLEKLKEGNTNGQISSGSKTLYAEAKALKRIEVWLLAGDVIVDFCQGRTFYLVQESKPISTDETDPSMNEILDDDYGSKTSIDTRARNSENNYSRVRSRRQATPYRGRFRGQTQSQYLHFSNGEDKEGKAEAEATHQSSHAVVSGNRGMGQAQSMSSAGTGCEDCPGYQGPGAAPERYVQTGTIPGGVVTYPGGVPVGQNGQYINGRVTGTEGGRGVYPGDRFVPGKTIPPGGSVTYPGGVIPGTTITNGNGQGTYPPRIIPGTVGGPTYPGGVGPGTIGGDSGGRGQQYPGIVVTNGDRGSTKVPGTTGVHYPGTVPGGRVSTGTILPGGGVIYPGGTGTVYPGSGLYPGTITAGGGGTVSITPGGGQPVGPGTVPGGVSRPGGIGPGDGTVSIGGYPGGVVPGRGPGTVSGEVRYPHGGVPGGDSGAITPGGGGGGVGYPGGIVHGGGGDVTYPGGFVHGGGAGTVQPGGGGGGGVSYPGGIVPGGGAGTVQPGGGGGGGGGVSYPGGIVPGGGAGTVQPGGGGGGGGVSYPGGIVPGGGAGTVQPGGGISYPGGIVPGGGAGTVQQGGGGPYPGGVVHGGGAGTIQQGGGVPYPGGVVHGGDAGTVQQGGGVPYPGGVVHGGGAGPVQPGGGVPYPGGVVHGGGAGPVQPDGSVTYPGGVVHGGGVGTIPPGGGISYPGGVVHGGGAGAGPPGGGVSYPGGVVHGGGAGTVPQGGVVTYPGGVVPGGDAGTIRPGGGVTYPGGAVPGGVYPGTYPTGVAPGGVITGPGYPTSFYPGQQPGIYPPGQGELGQLQRFPKPGGTADDDTADSQASSSVKQDDSGTHANANAQGKYGQGTAQSQVSGTYTGSGGFSAQAGTSDGTKSAQTQVTGGKEGAVSNAQGVGGQGKSQVQVQLNSETGATSTGAQSSGWNHGTNSQVQASAKGGMADAQANGEGSTSSQAQIGFQPYLKNEQKVESRARPFRGGGEASAQSGTYRGQSQSHLQGSFQYGITYTGAAQAGSGSGAAASRKPFNFSGSDPNLFKPFKQYDAPAISNDRDIDSANTGHNVNQDEDNLRTSSSSRRAVVTTGNADSQGNETTEKEGTASKPDYQAYDMNGNEEYEDEYDDQEYDTLAAQRSQPRPEPGATRDEGNVGNGQSQSIKVAAGNQYQAHVVQNSNAPKVGEIMQPGQSLPGYTIPAGFRGRVTSVSGYKNVAEGDGASQSQTVSLVPRGPNVTTENRITASHTRSLQSHSSRTGNAYSNGGKSQGNVHDSRSQQSTSTGHSRSTGSSKPDYYTVTNSVAGRLDGSRSQPRKYEHRYYTKSSTCGYFTFSCNVVYGSNGRTKICKPKMPTYPDGTPMQC